MKRQFLSFLNRRWNQSFTNSCTMYSMNSCTHTNDHENDVCDIIQLLTIEPLDGMWYPPENTYIDQSSSRCQYWYCMVDINFISDDLIGNKSFIIWSGFEPMKKCSFVGHIIKMCVEVNRNCYDSFDCKCLWLLPVLWIVINCKLKNRKQLLRYFKIYFYTFTIIVLRFWPIR